MRMTGLWNDVRFVLRGLVRAPGFTLIVIGTLAVAIGIAGPIVDSIVNAIDAPNGRAAPRYIVVLGIQHSGSDPGITVMAAA